MAYESDITAWLATQQDAMLGMLREMVDTDSGSYNKPGIDAVGAVVQRFLTEHGIPVETIRQPKHGDCLRARSPGRPGRQRRRQHRADGPPRHRLSRWRGDPPPLHHPRRHRLWPGRRRHEGRAGDELLRPRRLRQIRRRPCPAGRPVHRRRGDRQPGRPRRHRGRGPPRPRGVQQRARPRLRQRRHRPQGRRVHGVPGHRQGRPLRRQLRRRASAPSRNWRARSRPSMR